VIDHAAVVALPPKLAPVNVIAVGVADWQVVIVGPGVTVGRALIIICLVWLAAAQVPGASVVSVSVTIPK
jgi:hypothetical protein